MKIGIVQPVVGSIGGNDTVLHKMISTLKNHDVTLFTFSKNSIDGIKVQSKIPVKLPLFGMYQRLFIPSFDYSEMDVIIANGIIPKTDKRLIVYDQNQMADSLSGTLSSKYNHGFWKLYSLPYRMMQKKETPKAEYYSCSQYSADELSKMINQPVGVLYPGIDLSEFYITEKRIHACMVARISPEKNLEFAVRVLNQMPFDSVIFGNVTRANMPYFARLKRMANSNVTIRSGDRDDLKQLLAESRIYFSVSRETFGISTVEAIASGCLPIVPDNSAHPEVVPIPELRYKEDDIQSAMSCIANADYTNLELLQNHIHKFDIKRFEEGLTSLIKT